MSFLDTLLREGSERMALPVLNKDFHIVRVKPGEQIPNNYYMTRGTRQGVERFMYTRTGAQRIVAGPMNGGNKAAYYWWCAVPGPRRRVSKKWGEYCL